MDNLKNVTRLVRTILAEDEKSRNSDHYLYYKVILNYGAIFGMDMNRISITEFLLMRGDWGIPGFETVRRTRQKVQQHFPELRAKEEVAEMRLMRECEFEDYARGVVV